MKRFATLWRVLRGTPDTREQIGALTRYFKEAPPSDAAWTIALLLQKRKLPRSVSLATLGELVTREVGISPWLLDACCEASGDMAETLALLIPGRVQEGEHSLREIVEERVLKLGTLSRTELEDVVRRAWRELGTGELELWHRLISGTFRVAPSSVLQAVSQAFGVPELELAYRLTGAWEPTADSFQQLVEDTAVVGASYPFMDLSGIFELSRVKNFSRYQFEWKWKGERAQLIRRNGRLLIWSREGSLLNAASPELVADLLPDGTVIDGVLTRGKNILQAAEPARGASFIAFDLLERSGVDWRSAPLESRRAELELLASPVITPSPVLAAETQEEAALHLKTVRQRGFAALIAKDRGLPYGGSGWWEWLPEPFTIGAVLLYAERGVASGSFANYTFGIWKHDRLVPIAQTALGLSSDEESEISAFIRSHATQRYGPVTAVEPRLVFEIAFDRVETSNRRRAGVALRSPRIIRRLPEIALERAGRVEELEAMMGQGVSFLDEHDEAC